MKKIISTLALASLVFGPSAVFADTATPTTLVPVVVTPTPVVIPTPVLTKAEKKAALKKANEDFLAAMKIARVTHLDATKKAMADRSAALKAAKTKEERKATKDTFKKAMKDAAAARTIAEKAARLALQNAKKALR